MNLLLILIIIAAVFILTRPKPNKFGKMSNFNGGNVISSSTNEIDDTNGETVIIVYAPWCGHCKKSMTDFKEAVSQSGGKIKLINGDEEPEIVSKYNVKGFPTIMKTNGRLYTGHRDADSILRFAGVSN